MGVAEVAEAAEVAAGAGALLERTAQVARLDALARSARGGAGCVAVVLGAAGIGKTRLLQHACAAARSAGMEVLQARGSDLERSFPHGVVRQLFERALRRTAATEDSALAGVASLAAAAVGTPGRVGGASGSELPSDRFAVMHGLYWLTSNLAERAPLVVAVDDAHWSDTASLEFIGYLARRVVDLPVLVLIAARTEQANPEEPLVDRVVCDPGTVVLELSPLSESASAALVRALLGSGAPAALCRACHKASGGNPFLLRELAVALQGRGLTSDVADVDAVARLAPEGIRRTILLRLSQLPAAAADLARAAAVLGDGAEPAEAAGLAGLEPGVASEACDALTVAGILQPRRPLQFVHPVVREAIHGDQLPGERARAHARAAEVLRRRRAPVERIAAQLLAAGPPASESWLEPESTTEVLCAAAEQASARGAPATAVTYLRRAAADGRPGAQRGELLRRLGACELRAGEEPAGIEHLRTAIDLIGDQGRRARTALKVGRALTWSGRPQEAVDALQRAAALSEGDARVEIEAELIAAARMYLSTAGRATSYLARAGSASPAGEGSGARLMSAVRAVQAACAGEPVAGPLEAARLAVAEPHTLHHATLVLMMGEEYELADRYLGASLQRAVALGSVPEFITSSCYRSWIHYRRGRLADAEADARAALHAAADRGWHLMLPAACAALIDVLVERGALGEAEAVLDRAGPWQDVDSVYRTTLLVGRARLRLAGGHIRECLEDALECGRQLTAFGYGNPAMVSWRSIAIEALQRSGDTGRARSLAGEELRLAERFGAPRAIGMARRSCGLAETGAEAIDLFGGAAEALGGSGARLEHARALCDLGAALRRGGARSDAREPLRRGLEMADGCGATVLARRARDELQATGARLQRTRETGRESLTASELRVATLAAEGRSNREVAQSLFLSLKTVEMHLSRVYRKLEIESRAQLASALRV